MGEGRGESRSQPQGPISFLRQRSIGFAESSLPVPVRCEQQAIKPRSVYFLTEPQGERGDHLPIPLALFPLPEATLGFFLSEAALGLFLSEAALGFSLVWN